MDIQFCDLCNESVPLGDFALQRAFRRGERVICASCDAAMSSQERDGGVPLLSGSMAKSPTAPVTQGLSVTSGGPESTGQPDAAAKSGQERPAMRSAPGVFGLVFGTAALAAVGVGGALVLERVDQIGSKSDRLDQAVRTELGSLDRRVGDALAPVRKSIESSSIRSESALGAFERRSEERIAALEGQLERGMSRETELRAEIAALRASLDTVRGDALSAVERGRESVTRLDNVVEFHGNRLVQLEEQIREASALVAAGGPMRGPGSSPGAAAAGAIPEWQVRVPELQDPDPGIRLDAASILAESGDPAVVAHLLPLLDDDDLFVRMVVCQSLGKLGVKLACPGLIERLADESITVREAAVISLRQITTQNFGYEHDARESERKRKADLWRSWWRRSGDDFLAS